MSREKNIRDLTTELREKHNAPHKPNQEWVAERLYELAGWREDAHKQAREADAAILDAVGDLAGEMDAGELQAAQRLYAAHAVGLMTMVRQEWWSAESPLDVEDYLSVSWEVFLVSLLTYDREKAASLATYLDHHTTRSHIRQRIADTQPAGRGGSVHRQNVRRAVKRAQYELDDPDLDDIVELARDHVYALRDLTWETAHQWVREILEERPDKSLSDPVGEGEGKTRRLVDVLPSESPLSGRDDPRNVLQKISHAIGAGRTYRTLIPSADTLEDVAEEHLEAIAQTVGANAYRVFFPESDPLRTAPLEELAEALDAVRAYRALSLSEEGPKKSKPTHGSLSEQEVLELWGRYHSGGWTYDDLADEYDLSPSHVGRIIREDSYAAVDKPDPDSL